MRMILGLTSNECLDLLGAAEDCTSPEGGRSQSALSQDKRKNRRPKGKAAISSWARGGPDSHRCLGKSCDKSKDAEMGGLLQSLLCAA